MPYLKDPTKILLLHYTCSNSFFSLTYQKIIVSPQIDVPHFWSIYVLYKFLRAFRGSEFSRNGFLLFQNTSHFVGNEDTPTFQIVYRCFSLWHILLVHLRKCILAAATALVIYTRANLLFYSSLPQQSHCGRLMAQLFDWIWWRFPISCHGNHMVFLQFT